MGWDEARKSHDGLIAAGYRGPWQTDTEHPEKCKFCAKPLLWYMSKNTKLQPFDADFTPHHASCEAYRFSRIRPKVETRDPGDESAVGA